MALATTKRFDLPRKTVEIVNAPKELACHLCPRDFFLTASLLAHLESAHRINQKGNK